MSGDGTVEGVVDLGARVGDGLERLLGGIGVDTVFGGSERVGDRLVMRAATVMRAGGFGFGGGDNEEPDGERQVGGGGGGGGYGLGRAVAVVVVGPDGVTVKPVLDLTQIGLAALVTVATLLRLLRSAR